MTPEKEAVVKVKELIDTLWNVNWFCNFFFQDIDHELIDTLWNVNKFERMRIMKLPKN